jgi:hypothetical protein
LTAPVEIPNSLAASLKVISLSITFLAIIILISVDNFDGRPLGLFSLYGGGVNASITDPFRR